MDRDSLSVDPLSQFISMSRSLLSSDEKYVGNIIRNVQTLCRECNEGVDWCVCVCVCR